MVQNQLSSLIRMEGDMFDKQLVELATMFDVALDNEWCFNELYNNYPFPADLGNSVSVNKYLLAKPEHLYF